MASSTILLALAFVVIVPAPAAPTAACWKIMMQDSSLQPPSLRDPHRSNERRKSRIGILRKSGDRAREAIAGAAASCL